MWSRIWLVTALGKGGTGCDPTCITAHDFDDLHQVVLAHRCIIAGDFFNSRRNVFDHATVTWGVVCGDEVVVDCFWDTNHAEIIATFLSELGDLVRSVLRVVTTSVEEVADVVGLEDLQHTVVVLLALELKATSAECCARCVTQSADRLLSLCSKIDELLVQDAQHAVYATINFFDTLMVERFGNDTREAGVNDGCWATGLGDEAISFEFF